MSVDSGILMRLHWDSQQLLRKHDSRWCVKEHQHHQRSFFHWNEWWWLFSLFLHSSVTLSTPPPPLKWERWGLLCLVNEEVWGRRTGGNKEIGRKKKKGREGTEKSKRVGVSGCSRVCGPGGELPNPGCSAETSMGGCVGSHHDSSGSLNENSDGTGGNLKPGGLMDVFGCPRAVEGLSACCPGWRSSSVFQSRARRRQTEKPSPAVCSPTAGCEGSPGLRTSLQSRFIYVFMYLVSCAASLCSLTGLAG